MEDIMREKALNASWTTLHAVQKGCVSTVHAVQQINVLLRAAICDSLNPSCHLLTDCSVSVDHLLWNRPMYKWEWRWWSCKCWVFKVMAFSCRWGDTISIMFGGFLPASDNCQNYSHLFQIHRKQDQDGSSQVNRPYLSLYWYTCLPPPHWSMTATKRHKMYFYKTSLFSHSVAAWLMGWRMGKFITKSPRRHNTGSMPNCDQLPGDVIGDWDWIWRTCFRLHDIDVLLLLYLHCH